MRTRFLLIALLCSGAAFAQTPPSSQGGLGHAAMNPPPPGTTADQACMGKAGGTPVAISDPNGQSRQVICGQQPMTGPQNPRLPPPHPPRPGTPPPITTPVPGQPDPAMPTSPPMQPVQR